MPTLPDALSHGHTLEKPARKTDTTFCAACGGWYMPAPKNQAEQAAAARPGRVCCVCGIGGALVTITPSVYAVTSEGRLQKTLRSNVFCVTCLRYAFSSPEGSMGRLVAQKLLGSILCVSKSLDGVITSRRGGVR